MRHFRQQQESQLVRFSGGAGFGAWMVAELSLKLLTANVNQYERLRRA